MKKVEYLPRDSYALIKWLDELYPARCMRPGETVEAHLRYAGTRDLVDQLVSRMNEELSGENES